MAAARRAALAAGLAAALLGLAGSAPARADEADDGEGAGETPDTWYAERVSSGDAPVRVEHFWSKGDWLRSEAVFAGHPIVTLVKGTRYVILDRLTGEGVSIGRSMKAMNEDASRARPFGNELHVLLASGGERVGEEELANGARCELFRLTNESGRKEVCVSPDGDRLPVMLDVWMRSSGRRMQSRYVQWSRGMSIPDGFFEPPADADLERLSYEEYVERSSQERIGPAPPMHADLLHGY